MEDVVEDTSNPKSESALSWNNEPSIGRWVEKGNPPEYRDTEDEVELEQEYEKVSRKRLEG